MKPRTVHVLRVLMFAGILLCIHWQHREYFQRQVRVENWSDVLPVIQGALPEADVVVNGSAAEADVETAAEVRDGNGQAIARVLRTSPAASHILGFSGPTDVLLVMNPDSKVIAVRILSSRDTRDHVQKVLDDEHFLQSLVGRSQQELLNLQDVDAVSGATLTSYAILESIRYRVSKLSTDGAGPSRLTSLKFPEPPRLKMSGCCTAMLRKLSRMLTALWSGRFLALTTLKQENCCVHHLRRTTTLDIRDRRMC